MNPDRLPGLPVELRLGGRAVLFVHRAEHAEAIAPRLEALRTAGAEVDARPTWHDLSLEAYHLVMYWPTDTPDDARACAAAARAAGRLVWCQDTPDISDITLPALLEAGPVRLAISTGGRSSALARAVRDALRPLFDDAFAASAWTAVRAKVKRPAVKLEPASARLHTGEPGAP
jgi:siroheme synthase-like protein